MPSSNQPEKTQTTASEEKNQQPKSSLRIAILVIALLVAAVAYYFYDRYSTIHPSTQDAYLNANVIQLAAQVEGPVAAVHVENNQFVQAGAVLFEIDPAMYSFAVKSARAQLDSAVQATDASGAGVAAAAATVRQRQTALEKTQTDLTRIRKLSATGAVAKAQLEDAVAAASEAGAAFDTAQAQLGEATAELGPGSGAANARVRAAAAALQRAEVDLAHTRVIAPADGWISSFSLRPGSVLQAFASVAALVNNKQWWVDANFKETDLARIRDGQPADITLDMYPDISFKGTVRSLSAGSGAAFSFLPPENATGNWVKVTQRFTVRVDVEKPNADPARPLRIGATAKVSIDTQAAKATAPSR